VAAVEGVGGELRGERRRDVRRPRGEHERYGALGTEQVGRRRDQRQQHQGHAQRGLAAHRLGALGRGERDARDAGDQSGHREHLAAADRLAEHAPAEVKEQHQPERQHRLDHGERSEGERGDLEPEAGYREGDPGQPAATPRKRGEQRRPERQRAADRARLEGLEHVRRLVAGGRGHRDGDAERQAAVNHCEHPRMRASLLAAGAAAAWSLPGLAPIMPSVSRVLGIPRRLDGDGIALTFDDGPHTQGTPAVMEVLERFGVPATFFLTGEQVERNPSLAAEIAAAGHAIALHGHRHRNMLRLTPSAVAEDLRRGQAAIAAATGLAPATYRPPFGIFSAGGLAAVRREGFEPILWSRWGRDWAGRATPDSIAATVAGELSPGDVLLLHDADHYSAAGSWRNTAGALPKVLQMLESRALRPVRLPVA
jgi:peptidoglycan/xylan/chitin deacetylase (PgdA/CDA1 family)